MSYEGSSCLVGLGLTPILDSGVQAIAPGVVHPRLPLGTFHVSVCAFPFFVFSAPLVFLSLLRVVVVSSGRGVYAPHPFYPIFLTHTSPLALFLWPAECLRGPVTTAVTAIIRYPTPNIFYSALNSSRRSLPCLATPLPPRCPACRAPGVLLPTTSQAKTRQDKPVLQQYRHFTLRVLSPPPRSFFLNFLSASDKHMVSVNWLLNDEPLSVKDALALELADDLLVGTSAATLRKALTDSGLGESVIGGGLSSELLQNTYSIGLKVRVCVCVCVFRSVCVSHLFFGEGRAPRNWIADKTRRCEQENVCMFLPMTRGSVRECVCGVGRVGLGDPSPGARGTGRDHETSAVILASFFVVNRRRHEMGQD